MSIMIKVRRNTAGIWYVQTACARTSPDARILDRKLVSEYVNASIAIIDAGLNLVYRYDPSSCTCSMQGANKNPRLVAIAAPIIERCNPDDCSRDNLEPFAH